MTEASDHLEVLITTISESYAIVVVEALKDRKIEAVVEGGLTLDFRIVPFGEVKVMVRHNDLVRARNALADIRDTEHNIDWDEVDVE